MAIQIADNFLYQGRKPLDSRIIVDTIADMAALAESIIYEGILVYNKEDKKYYKFDPSNDIDDTLGKWREFSSSGNALILDYSQNTEYLKNTLIIYDNKLYIATIDFTSANDEEEIGDNFNIDFESGNLAAISQEQNAIIREYQQATNYKKDTLIYCGDRIGRTTQDFMSDPSKLLLQNSFEKDIEAGNIVVDKIELSELDAHLLKLIPIMAFVTKEDVPRYDAHTFLNGDVPKFRDGTLLSEDEKKGCSFFYIIDTNGELIGLALITKYDEENDQFEVNVMKYGVGVEDNILPTEGILNKRTIGEIQIINKDSLLNPKIIIKSTPPTDENVLWYESDIYDSSEISIGQLPIKKYNPTTQEWDILENVPIRDTDVVKNSNDSSEWRYYRIYSDGNVFISLSQWQLVYDTNQILGKIIEVNNITHEVTIKIIHANDNSEPALLEDIQANVAIGAAPADFTYPEGMTFTEFVKKITLKDVLASFTFTASGSGLKRQGTTINGTTLIVNFTNLGNIGINTIKFYLGNLLLGEQDYMDGTTTYTETYSDTITNNSTFSVVIEYDKDYTANKEAKFIFVNPTYVGVVNNLTPTGEEITALTEFIKENKNGTYTITMIDKRTCFAYPASFGNLTSIKDNNNFQYINSFTKTTQEINGEDYNIYILTEPVTQTNFTWIIQ